MKHATVHIAGFTIPLIGLPPNATSDKCDRCKERFHIKELHWCNGRLLCPAHRLSPDNPATVKVRTELPRTD